MSATRGIRVPRTVTPRELLTQEERRQQAVFHRAIVKRDGYRCTICGRGVADLAGVYPDLKALWADHIVPRTLGGSDELSNGRTLCFFDNLQHGWRVRYAKRREI